MSDETVNPASASEGGYDGRVHSKYDWSTISPSTAVVEAVARAVDRDSTDLDSLYDTIDPDALDTLVQQVDSRRPLSDITVSFTFADRPVTVHSDGDVVVEPE